MNSCRATAFLFLVSMGSISAVLAQDESERKAYFGETHLHTTWSVDAFAIAGSTFNGPEEAYRYARGETINHPVGYPIKITTPLDWIGVTEHAEYLGAFTLAAEPDSLLKQRHAVWARTLDVGGGINPLVAYMGLAKSMTSGHLIDAFNDPVILKSMWRRLVNIADKYYEPGKLTTFAAYEWTAMPDNKNMHRNIFFRDSRKVPDQVFDSLMSDDPHDLWTWMDGQRAAGNELLAIAHNGNLSSGLMYPTDADLAGRPIDAAWANQRMRNEPLQEIKQGKGASETTPLLSPNDEFAGFENLEWMLLGAEGVPRQTGSYIRRAYRDGLSLNSLGGYNPYKFGLAGGADSHNAAGAYRQKNYFGNHASMDGTPEMRLSPEKQMGLDNRTLGTPGLSAVWAEENTREAIFDGMRRKETFATSGVRIVLRFFGGWNFEADALQQDDWVKKAYANGVSMGGDLQAGPGKAPTFIVHAIKDADSAHLDRVQIIKGWTDRGQSFEQIYDVAWSGDRILDPKTHRVESVGNTINYQDATYTNSIGSAQLKAVWTDPDFDAALDAFYYVRVLEIPTPRWPLIQSRALGQAPPDGVKLTTQERAWSSPIWYTPSAAARQGRPSGVTVAALLAKGASVLGDAELEELVVGKTIAVRNTVTGKRYKLFYGVNGRRMINEIDGNVPAGKLAGTMVATFGAGTVASYTIDNGQLITAVGEGELDIKVVKLGDEYYGARSDEFGFANYEVQKITD